MASPSNKPYCKEVDVEVEFPPHHKTCPYASQIIDTSSSLPRLFKNTSVSTSQRSVPDRNYHYSSLNEFEPRRRRVYFSDVS